MLGAAAGSAGNKGEVCKERHRHEMPVIIIDNYVTHVKRNEERPMKCSTFGSATECTLCGNLYNCNVLFYYIKCIFVSMTTVANVLMFEPLIAFSSSSSLLIIY